MDPLAPEVLKVMVRLLSSREIVKIFPCSRDMSCSVQGPKGMFTCVRPSQHDGPHVAHTSREDCCAVWLDDLYHEYK